MQWLEHYCRDLRFTVVFGVVASSPSDMVNFLIPMDYHGLVREGGGVPPTPWPTPLARRVGRPVPKREELPRFAGTGVGTTGGGENRPQTPSSPKIRWVRLKLELKRGKPS